MGIIDTFIDLLQNQPPYKKVKLSLAEYAQLSQCTNIHIDSFCEKCKKERTFSSQNLSMEFAMLRNEVIRHTPCPGSMSDYASISIPATSPESYSTSFVGTNFCCAHCGELHHFALRIDGMSICKIGQYPSFSRMETQELKKYKNLIPWYYTELTTSVNLYSQRLGIASFVYLRRILEDLVEKKYRALSEQDPRAKFIDKLNAVEKVETIIPTELTEIKAQLYSVLSKGIHEYSEEECLNLYDAVLYVVRAILDQELAKQEQIARAAEAKKIIAAKFKK